MLQDKLAAAVADAVSDYVRLRGLHGLCPDVRKWSSPPGPAAFLDAGLPKTSGPGSLPHGLSANPIDSLSLPRKTGRGSTLSRGRGGRDRRANSIPSPTWEEKGPEGLVSQVLSFDEIGEWVAVTNDSGSDPILSGPGEDVGEARFALMQTSCDQGLTGSRSTPELGGRVSDGSIAAKIIAESPSVDAKQVRSHFSTMRLTRGTVVARHPGSSYCFLVATVPPRGIPLPCEPLPIVLPSVVSFGAMQHRLRSGGKPCHRTRCQHWKLPWSFKQKGNNPANQQP